MSAVNSFKRFDLNNDILAHSCAFNDSGPNSAMMMMMMMMMMIKMKMTTMTMTMTMTMMMMLNEYPLWVPVFDIKASSRMN